MSHSCIPPHSPLSCRLQGSHGCREPGGLQLFDGGAGYSPTVPRDSQLCLSHPLPFQSPTQQKEVRNVPLRVRWGHREELSVLMTRARARLPPLEGGHLIFPCHLPTCGSQPSLEPEGDPGLCGAWASPVWGIPFSGGK
ncbi:unnamed protein product [Rangifer tarandus platyrhynchus]|uniref:Uncharacterized protein n=1 Tax=Rangifer tarandus platyrhynchus TaxID=3082113 RepID=A0AC59Z0L1_RANTA